jgi:hypothetical protein
MNRNADRAAPSGHSFAEKMEAMFADDCSAARRSPQFQQQGLPKRISEVLSYIWEPYY